tara:strand:- start:560 stop:1075 length:516 start_codon:yes stop_codon:yes gene_type:complete
MVRVYDDIISLECCEELITIFERSSESQEYINNNHTPCFTQLNINQHYPQFVDNLVGFVKKAYGSYCADIKNPFIPRLKELEEFRVKRYLPNRKERFDEHVDVTDYASARRGLAFLFYLNDNNGDTCFTDCVIHPRVGRVVVFPPTWEYPHCGISPTNQTKYIMSTYVHYG